MSKSTPGPWTALPAEDDKDYLRVRGARIGSRYKVANVHGGYAPGDEYPEWKAREEAETNANACLIAAAPELLEAAIAAEQALRYLAGTLHADRLAAAIAKALGSTP